MYNCIYEVLYMYVPRSSMSYKTWKLELICFIDICQKVYFSIV